MCIESLNCFRDQDAFPLEQIVEEVAMPIIHSLIHKLEDAFHCSPVLAAFSVFNLDYMPDSLHELTDYGNVCFKKIYRLVYSCAYY